MRNPRLRTGLYLLCLAVTVIPAKAATVVTLPATGITSGSATFNAIANPGGQFTTGFFEYGPTTNYGTSTSVQSLGSGTSNTNFN